MTSEQFIPDVALGSAAVTSPFWLHLLEKGLSWYVLILGAAVITLRLVIAARALRKKED